jgi:hypothetical protein
MDNKDRQDLYEKYVDRTMDNIRREASDRDDRIENQFNGMGKRLEDELGKVEERSELRDDAAQKDISVLQRKCDVAESKLATIGKLLWLLGSAVIAAIIKIILELLGKIQ